MFPYSSICMLCRSHGRLATKIFRERSTSLQMVHLRNICSCGDCGESNLGCPCNPMGGIWCSKSICNLCFSRQPCAPRTSRYLLVVTVGTHCSSLELQQPEHRCTSTQGGHKMKLALRRSSMDLVTSITSVRTLHAACWAGSASTG